MNDQDLITEIESIRRKNNVNWMNLVRLAFELDPVRAKQIIRQISEYDNQITDVLKKLAKTNDESL